MHYNNLWFIFLMCAFFPLGKSAAQSTDEWYEFESLQEAYRPLESPITLNPGVDYPGHNNYTVALGFEFRFFDQAIHSIRVQRNGVVHLGTLSELIDPFRPTLTVVPQSHIGYQIESYGPCQHRILKIEWRNMALLCQDSVVEGDVSFQLWLYEESNLVELRYGPQLNISAAESCSGNRWSYLGPRLRKEIDGPFAIITNSYEEPTLIQGTSPSLASSYNIQLAIPPDGIVYRFRPVPLIHESPFLVGPNPSTGEVYIESLTDTCEPLRITLPDLWGRVYLQAEASASSVPLDLHGFQPGCYMLRLYHPHTGVYHVVKLHLLE